MSHSLQPKQPKLLNYKNISIDKYEFLLPHKTQHGYYQSICNYRLSKNQVLPFYFESPKLKTISGIVRIDNQYYIDLELSHNGDLGLFYDFLIKNDNNNITKCQENSKEWFNQLMPLSIVESYYKSPIIKRTNGQLPVVRVRLPSYKGNILTEIFNIRKEKINDINCIQEGDYLIGIFEFSGLMFLSKNFSPCYEIQKIKLLKDNDTRVLSSGYIFSDMNEKVDIDINNSNTNNDSISNTINNILSDPIINVDVYESENENKIKDEINNKINNNTINKNKSNTQSKKSKSLFDMIKETTLQDLLIDDKLFSNNNKLFSNNKLFINSVLLNYKIVF